MVKPSTGFNSTFSSGFGISKPGSLTGNSGIGQTSGTALFSSSGLGSTGFGTPNAFGLSGASLSNSALGKSIGSSGLAGLGSSNALNGTSTSLQLQKPPLGNKRGKK